MIANGSYFGILQDKGFSAPLDLDFGLEGFVGPVFSHSRWSLPAVFLFFVLPCSFLGALWDGDGLSVRNSGFWGISQPPLLTAFPRELDFCALKRQILGVKRSNGMLATVPPTSLC